MMAGIAMAGTASAEWSNEMDKPVSVFPSGTNSYATVIKAGINGDVWAMIYHPNTKNAEGEEDIKNVVYEYRLQHFDRQGNPEFPEEGILLCDYSNWSYTVVNEYLLVDSEGNAVVAVNDCRNSNSNDKSYTAYKVSPTGEMLWGEDGVAVSDPLKPAEMAAWMDMVELEDHSYVFAWMEYINENAGQYEDDGVTPKPTKMVPHIYLQRLSQDGKALWGASKAFMPNDVTAYPKIVNSGDNTFILVYGRTDSTVLYAGKYDFECESVWGKDTRIYRGGFGQIPLQTILGVTGSGDGGVLVSWTDDRAGTNIESAYISYVDTDGKLGFAGASDEADVKLCYDDWRCFNLAAVPAADGSCFYAVWRRTDGQQRFQGIMMQKISKDGQLLWGDEAKEIEPTKVTSYGYVSLQPAGKSDACAFYEEYRSYFDQQCLAARFNAAGELVWENGSIALSVEERQAASLKSQPMPGQDAWLLTWSDGGSGENDKETTYMMQRLNENGTFGLPETSVKGVEAAPGVLAFDGTALTADLSDGTVVNVYDATGANVARYTLTAGHADVELPAGLYIASAAGEDSIKFVVK